MLGGLLIDLSAEQKHVLWLESDVGFTRYWIFSVGPVTLIFFQTYFLFSTRLWSLI